MAKSKAKYARAIRTVNVLELCNAGVGEPSVDAMVSYPDTKDGNKKAEEVFRRWIVGLANRVNSEEDSSDEIDLYEEDFEDALDNGYFEMNGIFIIITHSTHMNPLKK